MTDPADPRVGPQLQVRLFRPVDGARSGPGGHALPQGQPPGGRRPLGGRVRLPSGRLLRRARERIRPRDAGLRVTGACAIYGRLTAAEVLRLAGHARSSIRRATSRPVPGASLRRPAPRCARSCSCGTWQKTASAPWPRWPASTKPRSTTPCWPPTCARWPRSTLLPGDRASVSRPPWTCAATCPGREYAIASRPVPIANLSGWAYPDIGLDPGPTFSDTLILVRDEMRRLKSGPLGLGDWLWLRAALRPAALRRRAASGDERWPDHHCAPSLRTLPSPTWARSNRAAWTSATSQSTQAFLTVPIMRPPFVFLGVSGFGQSLTLTAGFWEPAVDRRRVQRLLDAIERQLPRESSPRPTGTRRVGST